MGKRIINCALVAILLFTHAAALVAGPVRGRQLDVTFQLTNISDGADVTSGTVVVKVSKDGAAQATSTNSASHLGTGQWKITLTPSEMNATSVGLNITESGSYTLSPVILTEQPEPAKRWVSKYDNAPVGNLQSNFARAQATVDDAGAPIAADARRFTGADQSTAGFVDFQATAYDLGTQAYLYASGRDLDNTPIVVINDLANTDVDIARVNADKTVTLITSTDMASFPGAGGGVTYNARGAIVIYGTVVLMLERTNSSVVEGLTFCYTQDNGATWSRVENSATDGGGFDTPKATAYGTSADTIPRGKEWSIRVFPVGGVDANGEFNPNDFFITWSDYLHAGSPIPKGWQCGAFRLTRTNTASDFTINKNRVLYQRWEASVATNNLHGHSLALTGNGLFVLMNGDIVGQHAFHAISVPLDTYDTGSITVTTDWFGQTVANATNGKQCPQMIAPFPGWSGEVYGVNDTWGSPVLKFNNATTSADACVINSIKYVEADANSGIFKTGWDTLYSQWEPNIGGHGARVSTGGFGSFNQMRHYSEDGKNFAFVNNSDGYEGPQLICGDFFLTVRASDEMLMIADIPGVKTHNPLKLAPGANNLLTSAAPDVGSAATTGSTASLVNYVNGEFRYVTGGALVSNAPKTMPPLNNPILILMDPGAGSAANYAMGNWYLQASGQTVNIGSGVIGATMYYAGCSTNAVGSFSVKVGVAGAGADSADEMGLKMDVSKDQWIPFSRFGDPANNPTAARGLIQTNGGPAFASVNQSAPILMAIGGFYNAQLVTPWPTARLSTSNANEVASETLPSTYSNNWTVSTIIYRSMEQATIGTAPPAGVLYVLWRDANNYVSVNYDGPNGELEFTPTIAGVAGTTQVVVIEEWNRTAGIPITISDNGTNIVGSLVSPKNGLQTFTCSAVTLGGPPTQVRWSNFDQSAVYNYYTAGCEFRDEALSLQQQSWLLKSLDFIDTDNELIARAASKATKLQLVSNFDDVPTKVWQTPTTKLTALSTAGKVIVDTLVDTAEIGVAGAGLTNIDLPNQTMNVTGSWTGSISGSVGSISGITFPTNFASLGINASGHVSRVTLADTITTYTGNTPQTGNVYPLVDTEVTTLASSVSAVQSDTANLMSRISLARAGYLDNLNVGGSVATASAVSITDGKTDTMLSRLSSARAGYLDNLSVGPAATATELAALEDKIDIVSGVNLTVSDDLQTILGRVTEERAGFLDVLPLTFSNTDSIEDVTVKLDSMVEIDGGDWKFTEDSLVEAPSSGGGGGGTDESLLLTTTIASVTSNTTFTLTAGSNLTSAYIRMTAVIFDDSNNDFPTVRTISQYVGSTRTVVLASAAGFTPAVGDTVKIFVAPDALINGSGGNTIIQNTEETRP